MQDDQKPVNTPQNTPSSSPPAGQGLAADAARTGVDQAYDRPQDSNPYHRTHTENFDWRQYHSAWQQYYQQYYHQYYSQQIEAERNKAAPTPEDTTKKLKQDITNSVKERAKKIRHSHHFVPIVSALVVGALFLFLQFNSVMIAQVKAYVSPGAISGDALVLDPTASFNVGPEPKLIIPKINVDVPVDYNVATLDESKIQVSLRDGATHYKLPGANALPGQNGNTVLLGHSSNDVFNQGAYKFVFVLLDRVEVGDTFYLHYQGKRYIYRVSQKKVIDPRDISALQIGSDKPVVTLITCTPPGTALKRLLIFGEQISPDPNSATAAPKPSTNKNKDAVIPGNEPSVLESIWDFFF
jgi:sortase A